MSMSLSSTARVSRDWLESVTMEKVYKAFERMVVVVVTGSIMVLVSVGLYHLVETLINSLGAFDSVSEHVLFQSIFSIIFTLLIALEFKRSLLIAASSTGDVVRIRPIILIAMLATVRRFIIADISDVEIYSMLGMSVGILSLGAVYYLVSHAAGSEEDSGKRTSAT